MSRCLRNSSPDLEHVSHKSFPRVDHISVLCALNRCAVTFSMQSDDLAGEQAIKPSDSPGNWARWVSAGRFQFSSVMSIMVWLGLFVAGFSPVAAQAQQPNTVTSPPVNQPVTNPPVNGAGGAPGGQVNPGNNGPVAPPVAGAPRSAEPPPGILPPNQFPFYRGNSPPDGNRGHSNRGLVFQPLVVHSDLGTVVFMGQNNAMGR